jgi:hypothetical protein
MHLITAAVMGTFLGRKRPAGGGELPSFAGVLETEHALPGRLRLRAPLLAGQPRAAAQLEASLGRLEGIRSVEANALTGSLLIRFAPERVQAGMVIGAVVRLLGLERAVAHPPPAMIGQGIRSAGDALNQAIHRRSGGLLDLQTSMVLLLVTAGIRQLAAGNQFGWPLLWWAYRTVFPPERSRP